MKTMFRSAYHTAKSRLPRSFKEALKKVAANRISSRYIPLSIAILRVWTELRVLRTHRRSRRQFQALKGQRGLKIHLGCGSDIRPGWINIDLSLGQDVVYRPKAVCISHDLRTGLPLEEHSCDYIYSSHFFEHLEYAHGLKLMSDCYRALRPGGVFRVALPNCRALFEAYLRADASYLAQIEATRVLSNTDPTVRTFVDYINYAVYQYGEHKYIYDQEKLIAVLRQIGFRSVAESSFQSDIDPGSSLRRQYSFYMEAVK